MSNNTSITQCTNCDGELTFNPSAQTLDCPFCKSTYTLKGEVIQSQTGIVESPQLIIPFSFAKEVFDKEALLWLSQGEYTPGDILDSFHINSTKGVYIPIYIWDINYVIASPMGPRPGQTTAIALGEDQKKQPEELKTIAASLIKAKGNTKPFDKVYTLGFDILEDDETGDDSDRQDKADAFAMQTIIAENKLSDSKGITINKLSLTKIYVAFWMNKYSYQGQNYEVFMSGSDASRMGGTRPVDDAAMNASRPSFRNSLLVLLFSFVLSAIEIFAFKNAPGKATGIETAFFAIIGTIWFIVFPIMFIITLIRRMAWTSPAIKLKKEREEKLAQRQSQRA